MVPSPFDLVCELEGYLEAGMFGTVTVTGDAPTDPVPVYAPFADGPWADNGAEVVSESDWSTIETVEIDLGEFYFEPNEVRLNAGQPYKLVFKNVGEVKHEGTAPGFFNEVAFRKM